MELWLQEYLESERDSMFQNNKLNLPNRNISKIDWIPENRYSINLSYNKLEYLPFLHADIDYLALRQNRLYSLPLLPKRLKYLDVQHNPIVELPDLPKKLLLLNTSYCHLKYLPALPQTLQILYASCNDLMELPELPESLETLEVYENKIRELPYIPDGLRHLYIENNPCHEKYKGKKLSEIRELVKRRIANERCAMFKEELLMVALHPKRVEKWLSLGLGLGDM